MDDGMMDGWDARFTQWKFNGVHLGRYLGFEHAKLCNSWYFRVQESR